MTNFPQSFKASKGWLDKFCQRFNINIDDLESLKEDYKENPEITYAYPVTKVEKIEGEFGLPQKLEMNNFPSFFPNSEKENLPDNNFFMSNIPSYSQGKNLFQNKISNIMNGNSSPIHLPKLEEDIFLGNSDDEDGLKDPKDSKIKILP